MPYTLGRYARSPTSPEKGRPVDCTLGAAFLMVILVDRVDGSSVLFLLEEKCVMQSLLESVWERREVSESLTCNQSGSLSGPFDQLTDPSIHPIDPIHPSNQQSNHNDLLEAIQTRVEKMAAYFGRRCGVDEDDLRQEAWLAVLEMLPRLDHSVGTPEQHLLKRARWRILDTIRRQRRRQHVALDDIPPTMASYLDSRNGIDLSALFARLTIIQQRILRALMEGYTWREVGTIVGCTSANVAYHVRRIREVYVQLNGDDGV
jgi:RNA polymerase sigma factor (sigma-70 family)